MPKVRKRTRVVAPSAGCASRTRLRVTAGERALLAAVGAHLSAMRVADLPAALAGVKANDRAKRLMREFGVSSRYAETACADNDAAVKAARECLWNHRAGLRRAIARLEKRTSAPSRRLCGCGQRRGCEGCRDGYATENERVHKRRRLDVLRGELARVEQRLADKRYPVVLGTARLLGTRLHLELAGLTEAQWRERWTAQRAFFAAIGNTGKPGGNPCLTLTVDDVGDLRLTVSVPKPVAERFCVGTRVQLTHPVPWRFCGGELRERITQRKSIRLDVEFAADRRGRPCVFLRAAWQRPVAEPTTLVAARAGGVVGVDFNADHLAAWRLDPAGNPVGPPRRISLDVSGRPAKVRDQRLREALTTVIGYAVEAGATAIAVEDLGFTDEEKSRESYGRRKTFRHLVAGFATTQLRERLPRMAARHGLAVISVDPRYTSQHGGRTWAALLTSATAVVTPHEGAAVAIGRRALAHRLTARLPGQPRQRSVPHQSDGSTTSAARTGSAGQGRAPASAERRCTAHTGQPRGDASRLGVRRLPGQVTDLTGVDPVDTPDGSPQAGHRFAGASPPR